MGYRQRETIRASRTGRLDPLTRSQLKAEAMNAGFRALLHKKVKDHARWIRSNLLPIWNMNSAEMTSEDVDIFIAEMQERVDELRKLNEDIKEYERRRDKAMLLHDILVKYE